MTELTKTITHDAAGFHCMSHDGKNLGGPYKTRQEAEARLAEIEQFKHMAKRRAEIRTELTKYSDAQKRDKNGRWTVGGALNAIGRAGRATGRGAKSAVRQLPAVVKMVGNTAWEGFLGGLDMGVRAATNAAGEHAAEILTTAVVATVASMRNRKAGVEAEPFVTAHIDTETGDVTVQPAVEVKKPTIDWGGAKRIPFSGTEETPHELDQARKLWPDESGAPSSEAMAWLAGKAVGEGVKAWALTKADGKTVLVAMPLKSFDVGQFVDACMEELKAPVAKRAVFRLQ